MAAHSVTAASVAASAAADIEHGIAGAAITAGQAVYKHTDNTFRLAQSDGTAAEAAVYGIALNSAPASGQPVSICRRDVSFTPGFTIGSGVAVYLHTTAGSLGPVTDVASTNYGVVVGVGLASNKINLLPNVGGAVA